MRGQHEPTRKCQHGVHIPSDCRQEDPNPVCSICTPVAASLTLTKKEWKEIQSKESMKNL
jgi:hypothetical protein